MNPKVYKPGFAEGLDRPAPTDHPKFHPKIYRPDPSNKKKKSMSR